MRQEEGGGGRYGVQSLLSQKSLGFFYIPGFCYISYNGQRKHSNWRPGAFRN